MREYFKAGSSIFSKRVNLVISVVTIHVITNYYVTLSIK
nr:MAG TPA: hypothetical protein [Caudoviricetes sp.]